MKKETLEGWINSKVLYLKVANGLSNEIIIAQKYKIFTMLNKANALYIALSNTNIDNDNMTSHLLIEPKQEENKYYLTAYIFTSYEKSMAFVFERNLISRFGPTVTRLERFPSHHEHIFQELKDLGVKRYVINACDKYEITLTIGDLIYKNRFSKRYTSGYKVNGYCSNIKKICQLNLDEINQRDKLMSKIESEMYQKKEKERDNLVDEMRIENYMLLER